MSILLPYQCRLWRLLDTHHVVVCEKSRRIGMTWAAAFHEDLAELMKAAIALLIWQGKLLVISTHFGKGNAFYKLIEDIRSGQYDYAHLCVCFDDALRDGLYHRIAEVKRLPYSAIAEADWAARIRADYGDAAAEELDCIPGEHSGQYMPRSLLEGAVVEGVNIVRYCYDEDADVSHWRACVLQPALQSLRLEESCAIGVDFGRHHHHDLSVFYVLQIGADLRRHSRLIVELDATPFEQQYHILRAILEGCPRVNKVMMYKGGIGGYLHEEIERQFGASLIEGIQLSQGWYADRMPKLKAALEQNALSLPKDALIINDLCQVRIVQNIPRPVGRKNGRHADSAVALCLAYQASQADAGFAPNQVLDGTRRQFGTDEGFGF